MVELVDTQDLKSCDLKSRAGSIPALSTTGVSLKVLQVRNLQYHTPKAFKTAFHRAYRRIRFLTVTTS